MMRLPRLLFAFLLVARAAAAGEAPVTFDTTGGEAWTFHKRIEASVAGPHCEEVAIILPRVSIVMRPHDGRVLAEVPLESGDNRVEAECRRHGIAHGARAWQQWQVRLRDVPKAQARVAAIDTTLALDAGGSEAAPARAAPILRYEWRGAEGNPATLAGLPGEGQHLRLPAPAIDGEYRTTLKVTDALGRSDESTAMFRVSGGKPQAIDLAREHAAWIDDAVIYGVVPALFGPRGLADVTPHLDRLAALGVNTLWLSPITASPPGDFGYAVTDHFRLRESLGREADLRQMIAGAHARGLRVIIDFVPNHVSEQHAYFIDTVARARGSPYFGFFARGGSGEATHYFDWRNLKNLNYQNPEVERLVIESFAYWVREFDVDGFRVDVAWGPRERAPDFWPRWRDELKRIKPDLLLAEASARDPYYLQHGFDAAYDWTEKLGEWAWHAAFEDPAATAPRLRAAIAAAPGPTVFRFLNNNDTGARFHTRYGPPRTRLAATMLMTLPGLPGIYTGEEVGATYEPYAQAAPLAWDDPHQFQVWYARLIALRHAHSALRSDALSLLDTGPAGSALAYLRPGSTEQDSIAVLLNFSPQPIEIPMADAAWRPLLGRPLTDLLHGDRIVLEDHRASVRLPAHGSRVLQPR